MQCPTDEPPSDGARRQLCEEAPHDFHTQSAKALLQPINAAALKSGSSDVEVLKNKIGFMMMVQDSWYPSLFMLLVSLFDCVFGLKED